VEIFKNRYNPNRVTRDLTKTLITLTGIAQEAPPQIRGILDSLESGRFKVRVEDSGAEKRTCRWEKTVNRIILTVLTSILVLVSLALMLLGKSAWATFFGLLGFLFAGFLGSWVILSILRSGTF